MPHQYIGYACEVLANERFQGTVRKLAQRAGVNPPDFSRGEGLLRELVLFLLTGGLGEAVQTPDGLEAVLEGCVEHLKRDANTNLRIQIRVMDQMLNPSATMADVIRSVEQQEDPEGEAFDRAALAVRLIDALKSYFLGTRAVH